MPMLLWSMIFSPRSAATYTQVDDGRSGAELGMVVRYLAAISAAAAATGDGHLSPTKPELQRSADFGKLRERWKR
jgi:hypothetical protein